MSGAFFNVSILAVPLSSGLGLSQSVLATGTEYEWEYDNFDRVVKAPYIAPAETDWRNAYFRTHRLPSMNLYEYAHSNPTNYTDPFGLWSYAGMYNVVDRKYGEEGQELLAFAASPRGGEYVPVKRDYWFQDWYYEPGGVLWIASKWSYWGLSPRIWDDSDETAAQQLYAALRDRYGRTGGKFINCLCKLTPTYHWAQQAADDPEFFDAPDFQALAGDALGMQAQASMLGSHVQNEAVAEAQWWLAAAIGGHLAGKAIDALDDCLDARRLAKAAKAAPATATKLNPPIKITPEGMQHILDRHTINAIGKYAGKSKFNAGEDIAKLIQRGTQQPMVRQPNGYFARTFDVGRQIGINRATGRATSTMTVITRADGTLVTAFPGMP